MSSPYKMITSEPSLTMAPAIKDIEQGSDLLPYHDNSAGVDVKGDLTLLEKPHVAKPKWMSRPKRRWVHLLALFLLVLPITIFGARDIGRDILHWLRRHLHMHHHDVVHIDPQRDCIAYAAWDVTADAYTQTQNRAYQATAVFELPVSTSLYFESRGPSSLVEGSIEFTDDGMAGSDVISVEVTASYDRSDDLNITQTCWLQSQFEGSPWRNGVGIFSPDEWKAPIDAVSGAPLSFDIRVRFPRRPEFPLGLKSLQTSLPHFAHHVGNFQSSVSVESITLDSRGLKKRGYERNVGGGPITVESFSGKWGLFSTDNAEISGKFEVSRGLTLFAGRSVVNADVTLVNSDDQPPTTLVVENRMREHNCNVTLVSANESGMGGAFDVQVGGESSPVTVGIPYAPLDSILKFEAIGTNAALHATMHPAFEGTFLVTNQPSTPVVVNSFAEDPAHSGRERVVDVRRFSGSVQGSVAWRLPDTDRVTHRSRQSSVVVRGTGSTAVLVL
ncbi:hypothetical protein B0H21DRAFT_824216 [Amylocystis lapponica]|nr:hypothetical protein B0H21DRAFT_824216 [Amylocystis lapponica]